MRIIVRGFKVFALVVIDLRRFVLDKVKYFLIFSTFQVYKYTLRSKKES